MEMRAEIGWFKNTFFFDNLKPILPCLQSKYHCKKEEKKNDRTFFDDSKLKFDSDLSSAKVEKSGWVKIDLIQAKCKIMEVESGELTERASERTSHWSEIQLDWIAFGLKWRGYIAIRNGIQVHFSFFDIWLHLIQINSILPIFSGYRELYKWIKFIHITFKNKFENIFILFLINITSCEARFKWPFC